jgi:2-polyprenyl-3-methyl-5-hydroxy-6-metoxy-1,4-benzoquinol methylase
MSIAYAGSELELFQHAKNWKAYYNRLLAPFLGAEVLEVGAGLGGTTALICSGAQTRWVSLEPDPRLAGNIRAMLLAGSLPPCCEVVVGTTEALPPLPRFDSVLYIDVLEHIADDAAELRRAAALLRDGGHLIVLAPAHMRLFTPFDAAIGHHRRYDRAMLNAVMPPGFRTVSSRYLDSAGTLLSLANRLLLRAPMPTRRQLAIWDNLVIPVSRVLDPLLGYRVGKSLLDVRRKVPA